MTKPVTAEVLVQACSKCTGISCDEIMHGKASARLKGMGYAKHAVWWIMYNDLGFSFIEIARKFRVDHTTVVAAIGRSAKSPMKDKKRKMVARIIGLIRMELDMRYRPERCNRQRAHVKKVVISFVPRPDPSDSQPLPESNAPTDPKLELLLRRGLPRYNAEKLLSRIRI